jgi:hypothetical protein
MKYIYLFIHFLHFFIFILTLGGKYYSNCKFSYYFSDYPPILRIVVKSADLNYNH